MKNLILIAIVLTLATGTALARHKGDFKGPPRGNNNPVERLTDQLDLDADQVTAITAIFEESQVLREQEREAARVALCALRENTHTQILAELTPEQQALFDELQQEREDARAAYEETHPGRGFGRGFGGRHGKLDCDN